MCIWRVIGVNCCLGLGCKCFLFDQAHTVSLSVLVEAKAVGFPIKNYTRIRHYNSINQSSSYKYLLILHPIEFLKCRLFCIYRYIGLVGFAIGKIITINFINSL